MTKARACVHCYPAANNHIPNKFGSIVDFYLGIPLGFFARLLFPKIVRQSVPSLLQKCLIRLAEKTKQVKLSDQLDRSKFNNSILVLWDEARKRKLEISNLCNQGIHTQHFALRWQAKKYYFDTNPIYLLANTFKRYTRASVYDDKATLKKVLLKHGFPCPQGKAFISTRKALAYGKALGFPLLVKPAFSSLSRHVSFNIQSEEALKKAIKIAKQVNYRVMIERFIPGDVHRILILDKTLVACLKRTAAYVRGNGKDTIEALIEEKNQHPWRGEAKQKNCTLHKIEITKELANLLREQGLHLSAILKAGQEVHLSQKINSGNGADLTNVTQGCHPENIKLLEKAHQLLNLPLSGLDIICQDLSLPWQEQEFAIIENNSLPYLDLHHFPSEGEPIDVAAKVWDFVLASLSPNDPFK